MDYKTKQIPLNIRLLQLGFNRLNISIGDNILLFTLNKHIPQPLLTQFLAEIELEGADENEGQFCLGEFQIRNKSMQSYWQDRKYRVEEYTENAVGDLIDLLGGQSSIPVPTDSPLQHLAFKRLSEILGAGDYTTIMLAISGIPCTFPEKPPEKRYNAYKIRNQSHNFRILKLRLACLIDLVAYLPAANRI